MSVAQLIAQPHVELVDNLLHVSEADFGGTVVELARELGAEGNPARLSQLLDHTVETGALVLRQGQNRALVDSVALEIDRLIETANSESEKIPTALQEPLTEHLKTLADLLSEHFDPRRARSLQNQIKTLVGDATSTELRRHVRTLLDDDGAIGSQVRAFTASNTDMLTRVNTLLGKIEQKLQLDDSLERSAHKGRPFEEVVQAELEAIHGPLGDEVRCVRSDYGLLPKTNKGAKAGDYLVVLNSEHTRGREVSYVVEAKTGPLRAAETKREIESAIANRGAAAGVLVFDHVVDAPLGGRTYMPHSDGRFTAVLDVDNGGSLAFEVACRQARLAALAEVRSEGQLEKGWVLAECNRLCEIVEDAGAMLGSVSTVERGAAEIRSRYTEMRRDALRLVDEIRAQAES